MKHQRIVIEITKAGEVLGDVEGGQGKTCLSQLEEILADLGSPAVTQKKPAFYQETQQNAGQALRRRT